MKHQKINKKNMKHIKLFEQFANEAKDTIEVQDKELIKLLEESFKWDNTTFIGQDQKGVGYVTLIESFKKDDEAQNFYGETAIQAADVIVKNKLNYMIYESHPEGNTAIVKMKHKINGYRL